MGDLHGHDRMHFTTKVMSSNPAHGEVYSIQHCVIKFVSYLQQLWFSPGTPVSSTNETERHDITEILLKVLNTITMTLIINIVEIHKHQSTNLIHLVRISP